MEKQATIVPLHEEGNMKNMYDEGSNVCSSHDYLHTYYSWEIENNALSYEDYIMKDNGEGK